MIVARATAPVVMAHTAVELSLSTIASRRLRSMTTGLSDLSLVVAATVIVIALGHDLALGPAQSTVAFAVRLMIPLTPRFRASALGSPALWSVD